MSTFASTLSARWATALATLRSWLLIPDPEALDFPFAPGDISQLHRVTAGPAAASIDDQTWRELLLDRYCAQLSGEVSIFGQQVLHQRLRAGLDDAACAALGRRLRALTKDPAGLEQLHHACVALRRAEVDVAELLFGQERPRLSAWAGRLWLVPLGLAASLAALAMSPFASLGVALALYWLMALQMRFHRRVQEWGWTLVALQMLLRTCSVLGAREHPLLREFTDSSAEAGRTSRRLGRWPDGGLGVKLYADWFLLANVAHYFKSMDIVFGNLEFLRGCYTRCANTEADIALARHLLTTPACWAERREDAGIALEQAVHPLLEQAAPLTIGLQGKGAFISGQNGVGKSTLLRTVGLNLVAARAFGFCYARSARVAALPVRASMQSEDSLLGGESLYMAELRRAQELLALAAGPQQGIYIIDEIFRGTNHLESVSAAAAVLDALAAQGTVIVSSHNLVLASLLAHRLTPLCVTAPGGDTRRLALVPGVLAHTNGIALLAARGFGKQIEANAARVFDWLGAYLAQPADCAHLLGAPAAPAQPEHAPPLTSAA